MQEAPKIDSSDAFLLLIVQILDELLQPFRWHLVDKLLGLFPFNFWLIRHLTLTISRPDVPLLGLIHHLNIAPVLVLVRHLLINHMHTYFYRPLYTTLTLCGYGLSQTFQIYLNLVVWMLNIVVLYPGSCTWRWSERTTCPQRNVLLNTHIIRDYLSIMNLQLI